MFINVSILLYVRHRQSNQTDDIIINDYNVIGITFCTKNLCGFIIIGAICSLYHTFLYLYSNYYFDCNSAGVVSPTFHPSIIIAV